ncbi:MAG TPA: hypothetical protein VNJ01_15410 [Bacteriovoracaceae bacterium]|nr:hypothetical protein [Bacteriovoracaceae bacterium]
MISTKLGTLLKKNTKSKQWWLKVAVALVLSNAFFFLLFSGTPQTLEAKIPTGWVEVQLSAALLTPFEHGKRILVVQRLRRKKLEGIMHTPKSEGTETFTVLVREEEAEALFRYQDWEVLPFLKNLTFASKPKGENHEIRY